MDCHVVVSASRGYEQGLRAFVNSFAALHAGRQIVLHLLAYRDLPSEAIGRARAAWPQVRVVETPADHGPDWTCKLWRFAYAADLQGLVMLADADMFFCADVWPCFEIAGAGLIVGGSNGYPIRFDDKYCQSCGFDIPRVAHAKTITSVPTWLDTARHGDLWRRLWNVRQTARECDFVLQNALILAMGKLDSVWVLPCQQVTGVHEFQLKENTRVVQRDGILMTEDQLPVLMVHGKWWDDGWRRGTLGNMERNFKGDDRALAAARDSLRTLHQRFLSALAGSSVGAAEKGACYGAAGAAEGRP